MEENINYELYFLKREMEQSKEEIDKFKESFAKHIKDEMGSDIIETLETSKRESKIKKFMKKIIKTCMGNNF